MGLFGRSRQPEPRLRSITGASKLLELSNDDRRNQALKRVEEWQTRVWEYYDEIGEVRFAARYMGDSLARLRLYPAYREYPGGPPLPMVLPEREDKDYAKLLADLPFTEAEALLAQDTLARLQSPLGGQREIQRRLGVQLFVPGEGYLVVEPIEDDPAGETERWEVYSSEELILDNDNKIELADGRKVPSLKIRGADKQDVRTLPSESVAYRIWRPHARFRDWADSPLRPARTILDELVILTRAVRGAVVSRLKGPGVLFLPNSMKGALAAAPTAGGDGQANLDPVTRDILEAVSTAIQEPGAASSQVPVVIFIRDDLWKELDVQGKHLTWGTEIDQVEVEQRAECIKRFAVAIDLPAEVLTGIADMNHWSAWEVPIEAFRGHIEPYAVLMVDALTNVYFRPALAVGGIEDPQRFCVWYDPSELVSEPDPTDKALRAGEADLISEATQRRELGYSEDDAPSPEELAEKSARALARSGRQPLPVEMPSQAVPPAELPAPSVPEQATVRALPAAVDADGVRLQEQLAALDAGLLREAHSRADQAMRRALERANARLRSLAQKSGAAYAAAAVHSAESLQVGPTLGPVLIRQLVAANEDVDEALFGGAFAGYLDWWDTRVERASDEIVRLTGLYGDLPVGAEDQQRAALAEDRREGGWALTVALAALAGTLLLRPEAPAGPGESDGSLVPPGTIRSSLARAGGGGEKAVSLASGQRFGSLFGLAGIDWSGWVWNYGDATARHHPFEPHRALDGAVFADPDADRLGNTTTASGYSFPGVSHFWPGDHAGCLCTASRVGPSRRLPIVVPSTLIATGSTP